MAKQPETLFKERALKDLQRFNNAWFLKVQMLVARGIPDILACINGHFVAIELKRNKASKPTKLQSYVLQKIRKAGGLSYVAYPENWDGILEDIRNEVY